MPDKQLEQYIVNEVQSPSLTVAELCSPLGSRSPNPRIKLGLLQQSSMDSSMSGEALRI